MARDFLCIPLAGVGVERVFNFARDMCGYRRGHLLPETIRALLIVYHHQISGSRINQFRSTLDSTMNTEQMTAEEIDEEIITQEKEINLRLLEVDQWDQDQYISDEEEVEGATGLGLSRTVHTQARVDYMQRKAREREQLNLPTQQELSTFQRRQQAERREFLETRAAQEDSEMYTFIGSSPLCPPLSSNGQPNGDYELPRLSLNPKSPSPSARRPVKRGWDVLDKHLERSKRR
jgi:hypothetical protein